MELVEMFEQMRSGAVKAHSELGTRDEAKQTRNYSTRYTKLKPVTNIRGRILAMKDLVIKFNPFTGEADDTYNADTPFRPILLVSDSLRSINRACAQDAKLKEFWEKLLKITMPLDEATREEYLAFKKAKMIFPRVTSYAVVNINFGGVAGFPTYARKYTVDPTVINPDGFDYYPESAPLSSRLSSLGYSILSREADHVAEQMTKQGQSKDAISKERSAIFVRNPISRPRPLNLIAFLFLPLGAPAPEVSPDNPKSLEPCIYYLTKTDKWETSMHEILKDDRYDELIDFYDLTVQTPSSTQLKPDGKVFTDEDSFDIYNAMLIKCTDYRDSMTTGSSIIDGKEVPNSELYASVMDTARAYFQYSQEESFKEDGDTFERIMSMSHRFRPMSSIEEKIVPAFNEKFAKSFANSPFFTDEIRKAYAAELVAINPENAMLTAAFDEDELEAASASEKTKLADVLNELAADEENDDLTPLPEEGDDTQS